MIVFYAALLILGQKQPMAPLAERLVSAARDQLSWGTRYDGRYVKIDYPNGDVPKSIGVCTDVVIRAYRSVGYDLQKLIHEDIQRRPASYPRAKRPDRNIDHRRVPNQIAFFKRYGSQPKPGDLKPGDLVFWKLPSGLDHVGIVSDRRSRLGRPLVIHNIGPEPREEDVLLADGWRIVARFRYPR